MCLAVSVISDHLHFATLASTLGLELREVTCHLTPDDGTLQNPSFRIMTHALGSGHWLQMLQM